MRCLWLLVLPWLVAGNIPSIHFHGSETPYHVSYITDDRKEINVRNVIFDKSSQESCACLVTCPSSLPIGFYQNMFEPCMDYDRPPNWLRLTKFVQDEETRRSGGMVHLHYTSRNDDSLFKRYIPSHIREYPTLYQTTKACLYDENFDGRLVEYYVFASNNRSLCCNDMSLDLCDKRDFIRDPVTFELDWKSSFEIEARHIAFPLLLLERIGLSGLSYGFHELVAPETFKNATIHVALMMPQRLLQDYWDVFHTHIVNTTFFESLEFDQLVSVHVRSMKRGLHLPDLPPESSGRLWLTISLVVVGCFLVIGGLIAWFYFLKKRSKGYMPVETEDE